MTNTQPANDSPFWPACVRDPGFLPWLSQFIVIVNNTQPDTPTDAMVRMTRMEGNVPPEWALAVLFLMEQARES